MADLPELPLEPREPVVEGYCTICGYEIYAGELAYQLCGEYVCQDCRENMREVIVGGE